MYTLLANGLPWIPVLASACHYVQESGAKRSLSLCSSERSPNFLARETSSPKVPILLCSITIYLLSKHNAIIKLL